MTSLMNNNCKNVSHIISIWNYASEYKKLVNEFIESDYDGMNILHFLARDDNEEVIKLIFKNVDLKYGATVDLQDKKGMTPLHFAAKNGSLYMVKSLIKKKAVIEVPNKDVMTPLHFAAIYGHSSIVRCLVGHGADINLQNKKGMTPLHFAAIYGHSALFATL
nr:unnamed protein product [Callosobruchus chinensis]